MYDANRMAARAVQLKLKADEAPFKATTFGGLACSGVAALFAASLGWGIVIGAGVAGAGLGLYLGLRRRKHLKQQEKQVLATIERSNVPRE